MKFSICIPNYNYARYIRSTIASALAQAGDIEIVVADNASDDDSIEAVRALADPRIRLIENRWNVGFAANLDKVTEPATGEWMLLLSADDLMEPDALATYRRIIDALGPEAERTILSSAQHVIDGDGARTGKVGRDARLWADATIDPQLSAAAGVDVWSAPPKGLLRRSLLSLRTPFAFATTAYPRALYEAVEGYRSGRLIAPDKAFAWKILASAERALFVDAPLFSYRVHGNNQAAVQAQSGALKLVVDQYVASFDTAPRVLAAAGLSAADLAGAFMEHEIGLRGLQLVARGKRRDAARGLAFGRGAYPALMHRKSIVAMRVLLALGPLGTRIAAAFYDRMLARWQRGPDAVL